MLFTFFRIPNLFQHFRNNCAILEISYKNNNKKESMNSISLYINTLKIL